MFVHLGEGLIADTREVVAILDVRRLQRTAEARSLLERALRAHPAAWQARALVVTTTGLLAAPVSPVTVARRIEALAGMRPGRTAER